MNKLRLFTATVCAAIILMTGSAPTANAWGEEGHRFINLVAAQHLPDDMPAFFRSASARLSFLGPEPDRWRDSRELFKALSEVNGPDHFLDIDKPENFEALPNDRYLYADWLRAQGKDPKDIGYLPYSMLEGYQKVQVLFRLWRDPKHAADREQIEQNIVYYAGVLGHYVGDGSQPLHATIHFNGWSTSSNPDMFTREPLHGRFESEYVKAKIKAEDFSGLVRTARPLQDAFADIVNYLIETSKLAPELYRMEKIARWDAANTRPESKQFVSARLAAGSQMLANLWYTAWLSSAPAVEKPR
ncbi:MAG: nuclease [Acidobacteriota bacterium]